MNSTRLAFWLALLLPLSAAAGDPPGTARLISSTTFLNEQSTGDTFAQISAQEAVTYTLTGPAKFQIDFRVNMRKRGGALKPVNLEIFAGDSILTQLRINAHPGRGSAWRGEKEIKPSETAAFILQLAAGSQNVMFRIDDSAQYGAAVNVVDALQARKPLPADTPVLEVPVVPRSETPTTPTPPVTPVTAPPPAKTPTPIPAPAKNPTPTPPTVTTPAKPDPPPAIDSKPKPPPPPEEKDTAHLLTIRVGGGLGVQSELNAFDSSGLGAGLVGVHANLPAHLFVIAQYQFRYGSIAVPVVGGDNASTPEVRHEVDLSFGWAPVAMHSGDFSLSVPLSLSYQLLAFSNAIAPSVAGLIGLDVGLRLSKSWLTAEVSLGYGIRAHDSTPLAAAGGAINGRLRWQGELLAQVTPTFGAFVAYQGESIARSQSSRIGNALLAGMTLSLF